ncbi:MAG TPA: hypothetical protein PKL15_21655, partial [Saprospiraceae bacterium]|nr:hypothetical protein [Saprospiraceae bacterium]
MTHYYCHIFLLWLFISAGYPLKAQPQARPGPASVAGAVWPLVESRLNQPGADTARHFILGLVRDHCGTLYACQYQTCLDLMLRLENHRFNLPAAIFLGEELVKLARQHASKKDEATARMHLSRYFDALGIEKMAAQHLDQALALYEQAGERQAVRYVLANRLERSLRYRNAAEVLPELDALLDEAIRAGDTSTTDLLHIRMLDIKLRAGRYDAVGEHLNALDKIAATKPQQDRDWGVSIVAAMARAELAKAANKPG